MLKVDIGRSPLQRSIHIDEGAPKKSLVVSDRPIVKPITSSRKRLHICHQDASCNTSLHMITTSPLITRGILQYDSNTSFSPPQITSSQKTDYRKVLLSEVSDWAKHSPINQDSHALVQLRVTSFSLALKTTSHGFVDMVKRKWSALPSLLWCGPLGRDIKSDHYQKGGSTSFSPPEMMRSTFNEVRLINLLN
jgi:hypothetical protein